MNCDPTMSAPTILVVDDEPGIVRLVTLYLQQSGYSVTAELTGTGALESIEERHPDLIVMDIGLPDMDGYDMCQQIRSTSEIPIIILTARATPQDKIMGFEQGADDYVTKPFNPRELVARVGALLRRSELRTRKPQRYVIGGLDVNVAQRRVSVDGQEVNLRAREFDLLTELVCRAGRVVTREDLLSQVWGYEDSSARSTVDVHICRLRKKLGDSGREPRFIRTVTGVGYSFQEDREM